MKLVLLNTDPLVSILLPDGTTYGDLQRIVPDRWNRRELRSGFLVLDPGDGCQYAAGGEQPLRVGDMINSRSMVVVDDDDYSYE